MFYIHSSEHLIFDIWFVIYSEILPAEQWTIVDHHSRDGKVLNFNYYGSSKGWIPCLMSVVLTAAKCVQYTLSLPGSLIDTI